MSQIASKNLYDLLGNDPELDPDREPAPPTKVVDKPIPRTGKRDGAGDRPMRETSRGGGAARGGRGDQAGPPPNRSEREPRDDSARQDRHPRNTRGDRGEGRGRGRGRGRGEGRGGRGSGATFRDNRDDRQSHTGRTEHEKQAAAGWGNEQDGQAEWNDEKAGEAIARAESNDNPGFTPDTSGADPAFSNGPDMATEEDVAPEPEDNTKSYDQYLADLAEKRMALGDGSLEIRKPNEGSKQKFPEGKAFSRDPGAENFFVGAGGKARREKDTGPKKEVLTLDQQYYAPYESSERGGRGRGRGRGGRGGDRGDRGDRGGERRGRGGPRGGGGDRGDRGDRAGRGERGGFAGRGERGGRGGSRGGFNAADSTSFPALGS